ncbi:juvenile hormone acid O-methyltransferase-like [Centruroides sculpturatus]|uniref:juvenile hormone acid O-methyltransferase-like n=1 Tax=Centruroides sculpturatus TaxID=218467 RepID=UPI000C6E94EF|nr:juvenile hormone acid O-methyltransferase-like [Centruroides sculpturatus]
MEGTAEDYERLSTTLILRYVESALDLHFPNMKWSDEDIILDIGCGTGRTTKNILLPKCPKFKKIVAIDIMPKYIEYARKKYSDKRIEYETRDILQRPNVEEVKRYDKIVSFYVFHRISDFKKLFSVISSILKPGGYFSFTFFIKNPFFSILQEISNIDEWTKIIKRRHILDELPPFLNWKDVETEFSNFLSKFGLRVTSTNCEVFDVFYANKKAYLDTQLVLLPEKIFRGMQIEVRNRLWKLAEPTILKYSSVNENGEFFINCEVLQISGMKTI